MSIEHTCSICGADLTKPHSVMRSYPYQGHYEDNDEWVEDSNADNYTDTCTSCWQPI